MYFDIGEDIDKSGYYVEFGMAQVCIKWVNNCFAADKKMGQVPGGNLKVDQSVLRTFALILLIFKYG